MLLSALSSSRGQPVTYRVLVYLQTAAPLAPLVPIQRLETSASQLQRPLLCNRAPLPHAPLRHHLHRRLQVAHEQAARLHHVHVVLRLPGGQCHAREQGH